MCQTFCDPRCHCPGTAMARRSSVGRVRVFISGSRSPRIQTNVSTCGTPTPPTGSIWASGIALTPKGNRLSRRLLHHRQGVPRVLTTSAAGGRVHMIICMTTNGHAITAPSNQLTGSPSQRATMGMGSGASTIRPTKTTMILRGAMALEAYAPAAATALNQAAKSARKTMEAAATTAAAMGARCSQLIRAH